MQNGQNSAVGEKILDGVASKIATKPELQTQTKNEPKTETKSESKTESKSQNKPIQLTPHSEMKRKYNEDSEKISELYPDFPNWQIVVRLTKKTYKNFISKNTGKDTKVLNVELMDSTGEKITGAMFG